MVLVQKEESFQENSRIHYYCTLQFSSDSGSKSIGILIGRHVIVLLSAVYVRLVREKEKSPVRPFQFNHGIRVRSGVRERPYTTIVCEEPETIRSIIVLITSIRVRCSSTTAGNYGRAVENIDTTTLVDSSELYEHMLPRHRIFCFAPPTTIKSSIDYTRRHPKNIDNNKNKKKQNTIQPIPSLVI